jgi:hypothetical protein
LQSDSVCTTCQTQFIRTTKKSAECQACRSAKTKAWYAVNKDKYQEGRKDYYQENKEHITQKNKAARVKRVFGLTLEEYEAGRQAAVSCEICSGPFVEKGPELDHCHTTLKVRGWLCGRCNRMLGLVADSTETLIKAIKYLEKHAGN